MASWFLSVFVGIIAGILRSVLGFFKNSESEDFEWKKLLKSVIVMGITGGVIGLFTPNLLMAFGLAFTGGVAIEEVIKKFTNKE